MFLCKPSIPHHRRADKSWQDQFENFMDRFAFYLSRPQQHHFRYLITTMILWVGVHTIAQLSQVQRHLWDRDQSNINRFINRAPWQAEWLRKIRWQWVREQIQAVLPSPCQAKAPVTGYLVIDDTVTKKTGKKMAGLGWHYCHSEGRKVWGHCHVTALYVIAGLAYPVEVLLYQNRSVCQGKFRSKIDLAAQIISAFQPVSGTRTVVLFDSWYSSEAVIKAALSRGFEVVCALKSNRVVGKTPEASRVESSPLKVLTDTLDVHLVTVNNHSYQVRRLTGYLKGSLKATILITDAPEQKTKFLAHFHPEDEAAPLSSGEILSHYVNRWPIETFHRNAKQLLGFNHYRLRSTVGIKRYLEVLLMAYTVIENRRGLLALKDPDQPPPTLGEVCSLEQSESLAAFVVWVYDQFQRGTPVETVCRRIAG